MQSREFTRTVYNYDPSHMRQPIDSIRDYKEYRMYLIKNGTDEPVEIVFGAVEWSENIDSLGVELTTTLPRNRDDRHMSPYDIADIGDGIIFKNKDNILFEGMIERIVPSRYENSITCYDFGRLLGQSNVTKQFNNVRGDMAINTLCKENNIPIQNVEVMQTRITEIYKNTSISDIFKDIIEQENSKHNKNMFMNIRNSKLHVESMNKEPFRMRHKSAANIGAVDPTKVPGNIDKEKSLMEMKNHVRAVYEKTKDENTTIRVVAEAKDEDSIKKYGKRSHDESITKEDLDDAQSIANNKLRELQGVKVETTIELLAVDDIKCGYMINVENDTYDLKGNYKVLNCQQSYKNNNRTMIVDLEGV